MPIRNPDLLRQLHLRLRECLICGATSNGYHRLSLHHISKHPRDDVEANLVMLCGDGIQGCHGGIEAGNRVIKKLLAGYVRRHPERMAYLEQAHPEEGADNWLRRVYGA
jgi:hypothetical protein